MRAAIYVALVLAVGVLDPVRTENVLASAAAIILEALPYLCASVAVRRLARGRLESFFAYAGCGCGTIAAARSIPAACATALLFGPLVAIARVAAASCVARIDRHRHEPGDHIPSVAGDVWQLTPVAMVSALAMTVVPLVGIARFPRWLQLSGGMLLGVAMPPCALGSVAFAAVVHASAPVAGVGILCTAGIVELRRARGAPRDACAATYALLAAVCGIVAWQHGAGLVHPALAPALALCVPFLVLQAIHRRRAKAARAMLVVASLLLVAAVAGVPLPVYRATETTLGDAFAGEQLRFTGMYIEDHGRAALERYAITCCRADAAPVIVALTRKQNGVCEGCWVRASGTLEHDGDRLVLRTRSFERVAPPRDPFVYR